MMLNRIQLTIALVALVAALSAVGSAFASTPTRECTFNPYIRAANTCPSHRAQGHKRNRKQAVREQTRARVTIHCVNPYLRMSGSRCN
jgi:hypothetical protein